MCQAGKRPFKRCASCTSASSFTNLASSESKLIALVMDSTTDSHREFLALYFAGFLEFQKAWGHPGGIIEIQGHKATNQVDTVKRFLKEVNQYQLIKGWKLTQIFHISSLTTDNTRSNTRDKGGSGYLGERKTKGMGKSRN